MLADKSCQGSQLQQAFDLPAVAPGKVVCSCTFSYFPCQDPG